MAKIRLKRSTTASSAPTGLEAGEIAVNITDKRLFVGDGTNSQELTRRAASASAGYVQFSATTGALSDSAGLTFSTTNSTFVAGSWNIQSLTTSGDVWLSMNPIKPLRIYHANGGEIQIGDVDGNNNGSVLKVDDANSVITTTCDLTVASVCTAAQFFMLDADGSHSVAIKAPATVTSNVTLTLPATAGSDGEVLTTNGSGTLSWTSKGGFTPTQNEYTTSGSSTVTIPSGCTSFRITCIGGGGGGGSGRCGAYLAGRGGGGGGGGGSLSLMDWRVSDVGTAGSTVLSITVGAGGSGGAGSTTINTGTAGSLGGTTSVSRNSDSLVLCAAGGGQAGGAGGSGTAGGGGSFSADPSTFLGGQGGAGNLNSNASSGTQTNMGPSGGGGGGGVAATASGQKAGANGFRTSRMLSTTLVATGGAAVDTGTAGNGNNAVEYLPRAVGGGGSGGGGANQGKGGNGGDGFRGGGGGGGGAGLDGTGNGSGSGGTGGTGYVRIEWF